MKTKWYLFLAWAGLVGSLGILSSCDNATKELQYIYVGNTAYVCGLEEGAEGVTEIVIPPYIKANGNNFKYKVERVLNEAFKGNDEIRKVSIPITVTRIGTRAFYGCPNLRHVTIENPDAEIGLGAFANCDNLNAINNISNNSPAFMSIEDWIYSKHHDYAIFETNQQWGSVWSTPNQRKDLYIIFLRNNHTAVFVNTYNLQEEIGWDATYDYEIRDNKIRFFNGYWRYPTGKRISYFEMNAELENDGNRLGFTVTKYLNRFKVKAWLNHDISIPEEFVSYAKEHSNY